MVATSVNFAVATVPRKPAYIHQLMASLGKDFPITLVVGAPDASYLARYAHNETIRVVSTSEIEWQKFRESRVHHRATWNHWRTLTLGCSLPTARGLAFFEDDVIFARGWLRHMYGAINELERKHEGKFALSLYAPYEFKSRTRYKGYTVPYPLEWFFGTQAMYYPEPVRAGLADFLRVHGVEQDRLPSDILCREYLETANIPLAMTFPCLAQHIGKVTTGLGAFHDAPQFSNKIPRGSQG